jgi:polygalacturonase
MSAFLPSIRIPAFLRGIFWCSVLITSAAIGHAQDRRTVTEPALPAAVCTTLEPRGIGNEAARLQAALDACPVGQALKLQRGPLGDRFMSGPLRIPSGVTLWIDTGTTLAASTRPADFDTGGGQCGRIDGNGRGCQALLTLENTVHSGIVGEGEILGQGDQRMDGSSETWWQLARRAQREGGKQNNPRLIQINQSRDVVLYKIRLRNAPNFHVVLDRVQGFTAWGVVIDTPADARNTDGIDPGASEDITIAHSFIRTGDDNIAIKALRGPSRYISVLDNHFYSGHGMSIGSETNAGVSDVLVRGLTLDGTTWGLRIKSDADRGGMVERVRYEDVCLRNNRWPLSLTTRYAKSAAGSAIPQYRDIVFRSVLGQGGQPELQGYDEAHPLRVQLDGVRIDAAPPWKTLHTVLETPTPASPVPDCSARWHPFPEAQVPPGPTTGHVLRVGPGRPYPSVNAALADARAGDTLRIAPGTYREVVRLQLAGLRLLGEGSRPDDVVIEESRSASTTGATSKSAVVFAEADGIEIHNLTIANRFHDDYPEVTQGAQAVALYASGDRQRFVGLRLISYQDTLYAARRACAQGAACPPARQLYRDTTVIGAVDFIFGNALAYFDGVEIIGIARPQVIITAQSCQWEGEVCGYVFRNSRIHADATVQQIVLGRPWRALSTVSFLDSAMDARVMAAGFIDWNQENRLPTTRYAEVNSRGPGAAPAGSRQAHMRSLSAAQLHTMSHANHYLAGDDGWQPERSAP